MSEEEVADAGVEESAVESTSVAEVDTTATESPATGAEAQQPAQQEVWGAFRTLPQFQGQDDNSIARRLYEALQREQSATRALQQYQSLIPVTSEYLQYREPFEEWRRSQQQPQQAPAQAAAPKPAVEDSPWWNPPKVRESWKQYLVRDENGREVVSPDAPLDARHALTEYQAYKAQFAQKFLENPEQTLGPMVERVAMDRAQTIVQEQIQRMKDESYVSSLEKENSDWLYDQNGNVSPEGLACQKYIQDARQLGISGAQARWDYATRMVERDLLIANMRNSQQPQQQVPQQPPPAAAAPPAPNPAEAAARRNMEYLRQQAMRTASQRTAATTDPRTPKKPMTFADKLAENLRSEGLA
jgi:hypothetical protein